MTLRTQTASFLVSFETCRSKCHNVLELFLSAKPRRRADVERFIRTISELKAIGRSSTCMSVDLHRNLSQYAAISRMGPYNMGGRVCVAAAKKTSASIETIYC